MTGIRSSDGALVGARSQLKFKDGAGIATSVADSADGGNEMEVTITASPPAASITGPMLSLVPGTRPNVNGLLAWTEDPLMHSSSKTPVAATIYLRKIMVPTTTVFTNLLIVEATAGTSYTNAQLGLYSSAGTLLGSSAIQASAGTNGFGAAAPAVVTLPLTVVSGQSLTVTGGDAVFVWAALHMGTNSATAAQFTGSATGVAMTNLGQAASVVRSGTYVGHATNSLATIGNITPASISVSAPLNIWFGVS